MAKPTWADVHRLADARRVSLGMSKADFYKAAGISETTFRKMAKGIALSNGARQVRFCRGLGWAPDCIATILAGGDPEELPVRSVGGTGDRDDLARTDTYDSAAGSRSPAEVVARRLDRLIVDAIATSTLVDRHEKRLDAVEAERDRMRPRLDQIEAHLEAIERRLDRRDGRRSGA